MQLAQKQTLLNQAQTMSTLISQAQQAAAMEQTMMQAMYTQQQQQQQQQMSMNGTGQQGFRPQGWINPDRQVNQSHTDSPYQRLPINQRKKYMKNNNRPSDYVEVQQQYWQ